jgi:hypothetical protein
MFVLRNALVIGLASIGTALVGIPQASAAAYQFIEGYNVLDTNNAPILATGDVGTNFAATAGQERDIAVDNARGIVYIGRGTGAVPDGRGTVPVAISAFVITNNARPGSNFRDTGLITAVPVGGQPAFSFCQSLAYDPGSDKLWVLGSPLGANPIIYIAPGGTLGGAPNGDGIAATNIVLTKAFQLDTNLLETGVYVSPSVSTNNIPGRGGQPRGLAVRTVDGTNTTVYIGMGSHVQAWRNDQPLAGTNSPWRRIWATRRPPAQNVVSTRVAVTFTGVNGLAADDDGNCYFNVSPTTPARIWTVRPAFAESASDPFTLDYNDALFGGTSEGGILPVSIVGSAGAAITNNPQGITFCRFDAQKSLFVSFLTSSATTRGVTRLDIDDGLSSAGGIPFLRAVAVNGFGSGQPAAGQDSILSTMRLKGAVNVTQPYGAVAGLLYTDVDSVTNPTYLYVDAFVTDTNKGQLIPTAAIMKVQIPVDTNPPSITVNPANQTLLEGGSISLSVGASGQKPLRFQWQFNSADIPNATNQGFSISPASTNDSGLYRVVITNEVGSIISTTAQVTVNPLVRSAAMMTPSWSLAPGSRFYLTSDNTQRGLTYNPNSGDLLLVSRSPSNSIRALSAVDGTDMFAMAIDPGVVIGGVTLALNMIAATEDGNVYVCNLAQNAELFRIYRWASEDNETTPTLAFSAAANSLGAARWGDSFNLRGNTFDNSLQIIAGSRASNLVTIFTTADGGNTLISNVVRVPGAPNGAFGLSVSFGHSNTFWGKGDSSTALRLVQYDLANGTGVVLRTYGSASFALGATVVAFDPSRNVLAANSLENPDNLRLYDAADLDLGPRLVDQELFPRDNDNVNGTGAIDFSPDMVFALDSNNGIIAYTFGAIPPGPPGRITIVRNGGSVTLTWNGSYTLQSATLVTGPYNDVVGATSGYSENVSTAGEKYFRLRN